MHRDGRRVVGHSETGARYQAHIHRARLRLAQACEERRVRLPEKESPGFSRGENVKAVLCRSERRIMTDLQELLSEGTLGRILRSFREATGLVAIVIDVSGEPVLAPMAWEKCSVCRFVRASRPKGAQGAAPRTPMQATRRLVWATFTCSSATRGLSTGPLRW